jgi:hypothetical protein
MFTYIGKWIAAFFEYAAGKRAGEAAQEAADAKATMEALEKRNATDNQGASESDAARRDELRKWSRN